MESTGELSRRARSSATTTPAAEALKRGNRVLLTLKEDGHLAAIRELSVLAGEALAAAARGVTAPTGSPEPGRAREAVHALRIGSVKLARYWRLGSVQAHHSVMPD